MVKLKFIKTREVDDGFFSTQYLKEQLIFDGLSKERIMQNISGELYQGSAGFVMYIDGQEVLGSEEHGFGFCCYLMLRVFNDAVYDVITKGRGEFDIYEGSGSHNIISLKRDGEMVEFSVQKEHKLIKLDGKSVRLDQLVIEILNIMKEYKDIWKEVLAEIYPERCDEIINGIFSTSKKDNINGNDKILKKDKLSYGGCLPLDKAWEEYIKNKKYSFVDKIKNLILKKLV